MHRNSICGVYRWWHRVVEGQRLMQTVNDTFLGWTRRPETAHDFYWRQLRDWWRQWNREKVCFQCAVRNVALTIGVAQQSQGIKFQRVARNDAKSIHRADNMTSEQRRRRIFLPRHMT